MAIDGVVMEWRGPDHDDERRSLCTAFNGDLDGFVARQVKFARMHKDAILGGHYHSYRELFYLLEGEATFSLMDVQTREQQHLTMQKGHRLLIPPGVAHKATVRAQSVLVGCTEEQYISAAHNDHKYEF